MSTAFQDMVTLVHQQLTHNVYTFIFDATNHHEEEDQNRPPNAAEKKARKTKKEGKQVSLVVKAIEEWEIGLIKLSRSCQSSFPKLLVLTFSHRGSCHDF